MCHLDGGDSDDKSQMTQGNLSVWPDTIPDAPECPADLSVAPESVRNLMVDAIDVFQSCKWRPSATLCRTAIEAMIAERDPEFSGTLFEGLEKLAEDDSLASHFKALLHTLRKSGNANSHFNPQFQPTKDIAKETIELTLFVVDYLYMFPERIRSLEQKIVRHSQSEPSEK